MSPIFLSIQPEETGSRIKELMNDNNIKVKDVQKAMGFENPQAIYKWLSGKSLPNLDNFVILSRMLHKTIDEILVVE